MEWCTSSDNYILLPDDTNEAISLNSCINICKTFRDTIKGPLALLAHEIEHKADSNSSSSDENQWVSDLHAIENRIKILEQKTSNIESSSTVISYDSLSIDNLLKSYNDRLTILETKCANIQI